MLTDAQIKRLPIPPKTQKRPDVHTDYDALQLHIFNTGRKSWLFNFRWNGKEANLTLGRYPDLSLAEARRKRDEARAMLQQGIDPREAKRAAKAEATALTLADLIASYLQKESPSHKGHRWEVVRLNKIMRDFPGLCGLPITELHQRHMIQFRDSRWEEVSGDSVNREMQLLGGVFRYAIREMHVMTDSPLKDVRRPPKGKPRERRITQDEIDRICAACKYHPDQPPILHKQQAAWAFLFAIETAMRAGEICAMRWEHVHAKHVHLPDTKNGHSRNVPLSPTARALLQQVRGLDAERVLTVEAYSMLSLFYTAKGDAGFIREDDLHFHDTRHEATTRLAQTFPNVADLAKITGHRDLKRLLTYYNPTATELAERLEQGQADQGNVISFKKPASA